MARQSEAKKQSEPGAARPLAAPGVAGGALWASGSLIDANSNELRSNFAGEGAGVVMYAGSSGIFTSTTVEGSKRPGGGPALPVPASRTERALRRGSLRRHVIEERGPPTKRRQGKEETGRGWRPSNPRLEGGQQHESNRNIIEQQQN